MACAKCGQKKKAVSVVVANNDKDNITSTPTTTSRVAHSRGGTSNRRGPVYKTIARNPHLNGNLHWVSDWEYVVVSLDGVPLEPSTFIYACDEGWVDVITPDAVPTYSASGEVIDVSKQRLKGKVNIVSFSKNRCQDCRSVMKKVKWWDPSYYTKEVAGNVVTSKLNEKEQEMAKGIRAQVWKTRADKYR